MVDRMMIALLSNGHLLLEGCSRFGENVSIKSLAATVDGAFSRIQFTPDLLPADLVGTQIYQVKTR